MTNKSNELVYEFAKTEGGEEIGFNDSVTTTFKGHIAYSLARESIQNIIDATDDKTKPAVVEFTLKKIKGHDLPNHQQLTEIFQSCEKYYSNNQSCIDFFSKAHKMLNENKLINILKIADYNTSGMSGDDEDINGNYYNFLKSSGASSKSGGSGGSFGLGKGAYYAASSFHTIFVSSIYGNNEHVFQGKLRLVTHKKNGEKYQSTGSFGYKKQLAVRNEKHIPDLFKRSEKGTDISIVGFYETENWEEIIIKSVLTNFWLAILKNKLIVKINDHVEITSESLEKKMLETFKEFNKDLDSEQNPLQTYMAYMNNGSVTFQETLPTLGTVSLKFLLKDNYGKRIAFFRSTGMQIIKKRYPLPKAFAAVFECDNEQGNTILRAMENPEHDEWDPENAREKGDDIYNKAKKSEKELKQFINNCIKKLFTTQDKSDLKIPGLDKYLCLQTQEKPNLNGAGLLSEDANETQKPSEESAREVGINDNLKPDHEIAHQIKVIKIKTNVAIEGDKINVNGGGGRGGGSQKPKVEEEPEGKPGKLLKDMTIRTFASTDKNGLVEHTIVLHGTPGLNVALTVCAGTDDSQLPLTIKDAQSLSGKQLDIVNNIISKIQVGTDGTEKINVHFDDNEKYALNVQAYENK